MNDRRWMRTALGLARRGLGCTGTNPSVGCIVIADGRVLGRGRTGLDGRPHAETIALEDARTRGNEQALRGATAYVTLEPCAHTGQTPPCTEALIKSGIGRVVIPMEDPDPRVAGRGMEALRNAGVEVDCGILAEEAIHTLRGYLSRAERRRPFVTLKLAASLDGHIATRLGESRWITGEAARARVHLLRSRSDGLLVGVGSALADDPLLDVRLPGMESHKPARIVADSRLQTPLTGRLAQTVSEQDLILLCRGDNDPERVAAFADIGAIVLSVPVTESGTLSLRSAMGSLAERGIGSILCEGGGRLAASLMAEGLVDELVWFTAGAAIGSGGASAIADFGLERIAEMPRFTQVACETVGADVMSVWHPSQIT